MKRPTRNDVARLAGVSTATVSYVVKDGPKPVAPATRRRVLDAIAALGYEPNLIARSLRERRTRAFGLVIPGTAGVFFAEMADLIEVASFAAGHILIIGNARLDEATEMTYGRILAERQVDGVIFYASEPGLAAPRYVLDHGIPVVLIDREMKGARVRSVVVDGFAGGGLVAEHLLGLGHRVLGCIGGSLYGDPGPRGSTRRVDGFAATLRQAGIDVPQELIRSGDYSLRSGYDITRDLFSRTPGPTGLFCCNDLMAFGALRALKELGIRVPDDVAVVGFDNIPLAEYADPPLTTVEQPRDKIAHLAVELLRDLVAQPDLADCRTITLRPTLVVRKSSVRATST